EPWFHARTLAEAAQALDAPSRARAAPCPQAQSAPIPPSPQETLAALQRTPMTFRLIEFGR
ncbi:MAG TPA: hypothetical protein PLQ67_01035, partial [Burkholderiaceae bacterium]|nr:hypothetical protein [Burkholderiaceae bacterium]